MCISACQCVRVGLCVCVCMCVCSSAGFCVSVKVCCCSLEVAVSTCDWSLYPKSALYSLVTRGRCRASFLALFVGFFAVKKVCHFMSVCQIIRTALSKHRKKGFYLTFISLLSLPFKKKSHLLSVFCPTSHLNHEEKGATAYCPNWETLLLIVSASPAVAHCVAFSTNQSVVILHFLCMHERTNAQQTHFMSGTQLKNTS